MDGAGRGSDLHEILVGYHILGQGISSDPLKLYTTRVGCVDIETASLWRRRAFTSLLLHPARDADYMFGCERLNRQRDV